MKDIIFDREETNIGGIAQFTFFAEKEVNVFGDIINGQIHEIIFLDNNIQAATADIIQESANLTEEQKAHDLFEYTFTCKIAKDNIDKRSALLLLDTNKIIAKITDNNGEIRLLGEPGNACDVETELLKGDATAQLNHYKIKLTWKSRQRAPFANDLIIATADYECLNPVVPDPVAGTDFITSIDIHNNSPFSYTATQSFEIVGIGAKTVIKEIAAFTTETFQATIPIPSNVIGDFQFIRTGTCNSQETINVPNFAFFKNPAAIVMQTDSYLELYEGDIIIDASTLDYFGNSILKVKNNRIIAENAGVAFDIKFSDTQGNAYRFPCAENNGWTLHDVKQAKKMFFSKGTQPPVSADGWLRNYYTLVHIFYNLTYGCTRLIDTKTGKVIYVPYNEQKQKIFNP